MIQADARQLPLPAGCIDCVVTSPPYWQQRDYAHESQIGLESEQIGYITQLLRVFGRIRNSLAQGACVFVNLGDTYNAYNANRGKGKSFAARFDHARPVYSKGYGLICKAARNKSLIGIPYRFAIGMIDAGWILRSEIVWDKGKGMPQRVKDRPIRTHESVFLFTSDERYYWTPSSTRSVWRIPLAGVRGSHSAKMSVKLAARCIDLGCPAGGLVLDPFSGSGTTGVAARHLGRRFLGCDLKREFLADAKQRIERPGIPVMRPVRDERYPLFER
jgi:DNA modification methylase